MEYLELGQHALASIELYDVEGDLVDLFDLPQWSSSNQAVLRCIPSTDNPGYADIRGMQLGTAELRVKANYQSGSGQGTDSWNATLDIEIIDHKVATGEIKLSHGAIEPV